MSSPELEKSKSYAFRKVSALDSNPRTEILVKVGGDPFKMRAGTTCRIGGGLAWSALWRCPSH